MELPGTPACTFFAELLVLIAFAFSSNYTSDLMCLLNTHTLLTLLVINRNVSLHLKHFFFFSRMVIKECCVPWNFRNPVMCFDSSSGM